MPYLSALEPAGLGALPAASRTVVRQDLNPRTNAPGEPAAEAPRSDLSAAATIHTVPPLWIGKHEAVDAAAEETAETVSGIQIPGSLLAILAALVGLIAVSRRDFLGGDGPIGRLLRENQSGKHGLPVSAHHKDAGESG